MADFANMIYGTAQNVAQNDPVSAIKQGASLAIQVEEMQQKRQDLVQKQQALEIAKYDKVGGWMEAWTKMPEGGAKKAFAEKFIPNGVQALGLQDKIHPLNLEAMLKDSKLATGVISWVRGGGDPAILNDPTKLMEAAPHLLQLGSADEIAAVGGNMQDAVGKANEQSLDRKSQEKRAALAAQNAGARGSGIQDRFAAAQRTKLADKVNALGIPDIKVAIGELNGAIPGGIDGYKKGTPIPGISGGQALLPVNRLSGTAVQVRQSAQSVGNQILKLRSGAAVSDGEALRTLAELGMVPTIGEGGTWTGLTWKGATSEEAFVKGMKRAKNIVAAKEKTYRNAYGSETYDTVMQDVGTGDSSGSSGGKINLFGKSWTEDQWLSFLADHPKDSAVPAIKKKLGIK